ncbi:early secretory antigenic target protein ESAT-6 [Saccharothrix ecbatanensis]|uniref:ESAT-6-like protein n=1 Tax=Saccharothrix ecbatanensis TaxID=1105145 RepID=A0A7W9HPN6_9PSEU|nr:WXG100 family type VII secretion target [Saccharothrix ecbatanensis]MBB5806167.1 early secretory antigenic target protein ESAT-6 [Saccharothrix ecbatanensis]
MDISVDFNRLSSAAGDISGHASKVDSELDNLKTRIGQVVANWEGSASGTYQDAQRRWDESAAGLQQVLAQIGLAVAQATEAYQAAEKKNEGRW